MSADFKTNILSPQHWLRILVMVFFAVVTWVLGIIFTVLVVAQALFSLITGRDNPNLRQLGGALSLYFYQVLRFLVYRSEFRPFPFAPFPIDDEAEADPLAARGEAGHAPARQAPVARPDFASEHEPEAATAAGVAAAAVVAGSASAEASPAQRAVVSSDPASEVAPEAAATAPSSPVAASNTSVGSVAREVELVPDPQQSGQGPGGALDDSVAPVSTPADVAIEISQARPTQDVAGAAGEAPLPAASEEAPGITDDAPPGARDNQHKQSW